MRKSKRPTLRPRKKATTPPTEPSPPVGSADVATPSADQVARVEGTSPDPFDLNNLRLDQSFVETAGVRKLLRTVPVRKPHKQEFVRVHPDPAYRFDAPLIELQVDREAYVIVKELVPELLDEIITMTLFTAINRQGVTFLWPVRLPSGDAKPNEWHRSLREAAELATNKWVRVKANMALGAYEMSVATSEMSDPVWPDVPFQELVRIAFRERIITSLEHPVIKQLIGSN